MLEATLTKYLLKALAISCGSVAIIKNIGWSYVRQLF